MWFKLDFESHIFNVDFFGPIWAVTGKSDVIILVFSTQWPLMQVKTTTFFLFHLIFYLLSFFVIVIYIPVNLIYWVNSLVLVH